MNIISQHSCCWPGEDYEGKGAHRVPAVNQGRLHDWWCRLQKSSPLFLGLSLDLPQCFSNLLFNVAFPWVQQFLLVKGRLFKGLIPHSACWQGEGGTAHVSSHSLPSAFSAKAEQRWVRREPTEPTNSKKSV